MFLALGRRVVFGTMGFFALLGFVSVPLGDKTGWGHVQAILATSATKHAIAEFRESAEHSQHQLFDWLTSQLRPKSHAPAAPSTFVETERDGSAPRKTKMSTPKGSGPTSKIPSF